MCVENINFSNIRDMEMTVLAQDPGICIFIGTHLDAEAEFSGIILGETELKGTLICDKRSSN